MNFEIKSHRYSIRLAVNRQEIEEALHLRYTVFNVELGEGLEESEALQLDEDKYDEFCDHLIVLENDSNTIIGTYRMQDHTKAKNGQGFYTANEFDIQKFSPAILNNAVELGRACIHKDHRNGRVLFLLWRGLARYLVLSENKYLFGCCSITSQDQGEGIAIYNHLRENGFMHTDYLLPVSDDYKLTSGLKPEFQKEIKIPQLFKLYLDIGCKVCSPPAIDRSFKTIDFLVLLELDTVSSETLALFLR